MIRNALMFLAMAGLAVLMFLFIVWSNSIQPRKQRIDCTWSEISPDFTTEMKQACRQRHLQKQ
jgi:hypothetical protein